MARRYTRSRNSESRRLPAQHPQQQQGRVRSISQQPAEKFIQKSIWREPLLWLGIIAAVFILLYPLWQERKTQKVISVLATDFSDSGIADPKIPSGICQSRAEQLLAGDVEINLDFSDRAEITRNRKINNSTDLNQQCQETLFTTTERLKQISKRQGTNPIS